MARSDYHCSDPKCGHGLYAHQYMRTDTSTPPCNIVRTKVRPDEPIAHEPCECSGFTPGGK